MSISLLWARRFCRKLIRKSGNLALSNVNDERFVSSCWLKSNSAICPAGTINWRAAFLILKILKPLKLRSASDKNTNFAIIGYSPKQIFTIHEQCIFFSYGSKTPHNYSTLSNNDNLKLDPRWITGFADGEGSFQVSVRKNKNYKHGSRVEQRFTLVLHKKDEALLQKIKSSLGVGKIYKHGPESWQFKVYSFKELDTVIKHFNKYPLMTNKWSDFKLFLMVNEIMRRKEHLTEDELRKIVAIRASMNLGLSDVLKKAFPDVVPVERPVVSNPLTIDPEWLAGFVTGEGCFLIGVMNSKSTKLGKAVYLIFQITQHVRDENLIRWIRDYLNCGHVYQKGEAFDIRVTKFQDIVDKIIPFFKKYKIRGMKALDFEDWCKAAELMKEKKHLTAEGLEEIKKIKTGMNTGRKN